MEELVVLFSHNNILLFSESDFTPDKKIRIVVKNHFAKGEEINQKGITYYILDEDYNIGSKQMTQSWDALSVWFKMFKKHKIIGTYNFTNNTVTLNK